MSNKPTPDGCEECQRRAEGMPDLARRKHKTSIRGLVEALQIIERHSEHGHPHLDNYDAAHGIIWAGDYKSTHDKMSDEEKARMQELGWFEDKESWAVFC